MKSVDVGKLARYALFIAIIFILGFTPLGFIYLPIAAITMVHLPVIIGGYQFGVKGGALFGFFFGLMSLIKCFITPDATAAIILGTNTGFGVYNLFLIVAIIFIPRILTGVFSALLYQAIAKHERRGILAMGAAAFVGSMTNTVFYLGGLYLFAFNASAQLLGVAGSDLLKALLGIVALNGVLEAVAAVVICTPVGQALQFYNKKRNHNKGE